MSISTCCDEIARNICKNLESLLGVGSIKYEAHIPLDGRTYGYIDFIHKKSVVNINEHNLIRSDFEPMCEFVLIKFYKEAVG